MLTTTKSDISNVYYLIYLFNNRQTFFAFNSKFHLFFYFNGTIQNQQRQYIILAFWLTEIMIKLILLNILKTTARVSRCSRRCSIREGVFKIFAKLTGKHPYQSVFVNKVAGLSPETLLKTRLWHKCFPVNCGKFIRALLLQYNSGRLFLDFFRSIVKLPVHLLKESLSKEILTKQLLKSQKLGFFKGTLYTKFQ